MKPRDLLDLLLLAALWGGSFLFMRVAAPEFGAIALVEVRVAIAAAFLLALAAIRGRLAPLRTHAWPLLVVGTINSALPFCLFAYATLTLTAGFAGMLNATAPMWAALVAWAWVGERPSRVRLAGLAIGFAGVAVLAAGRGALAPGSGGLAIAAALAATLSYGVAASYTRQRLSQVDPLATATGSQLGAALVLAPAVLAAWPAQPPSPAAWASAAALGIASTGVAYVLFFRLIARVGPARAIAVTFLVPAFATAWGWLWLDEPVTPQMAAGGAVVLLGTALSTGLLSPRAAATASARASSRPARHRD